LKNSLFDVKLLLVSRERHGYTVGAYMEHQASVYGVWSGQSRDNLGTRSG